MWQDGVSLVAWFTLYDQPDARPVPVRPVVRGADAEGARAGVRVPARRTSHRSQLEVWGRTPGGQQADVTIQRSVRTAGTTSAR